MSLRIESLLGHASLESPFRAPKRRFGVPPGGPFDMESFTLANALVGNPDETPAVELGLAHLTATCERDCRLGIVGAELEIFVNGRPRDANAFSLTQGDRLELTRFRNGARAYLAAEGGIQRAELSVGGGIACPRRAVAADARLAKPPSSLAGKLRAIPGPDWDLIRELPLARETWTVAPSSDRMGVRLTGPVDLKRIEKTSEPACLGAVQMTGEELIIIGPDGPTIGGYPKVLVVCESDLDRVGQLVPGAKVDFEIVDMSTARRLHLERDRRLRRLASQLRAASAK